MKITLTKSKVEAIEAPMSGERVVWDDKLTGYGVRVSSKGRRTYFVQTRTRAGREIKMKIGVHGTITAEQARAIASRKLGEIAAGGDPAEDRRQAKTAEAKRRAIPTVAQLCDRYLTEWAEIHKRALSIRDDRSMIAGVIKPGLGGKRVTQITREDVAALHRGMKATPIRANRVVALMSKMFSLAVVEWKLCAENPAKGIRRYDEQPRQRHLSPDELARLADALAVYPNQATANAIRLLLLTGARRGEILTMTWDQVDQEPGTWIKPSSHTKQKTEHRVPLSPGAVAIIETMRKHRKLGEPYVFPGRGKEERPASELRSTWEVTASAAGITGCRLHDLRHTYASLLVNSGHSLPLIGALLGHTQVKTTARYSHLADAALREATGRVDAQLAALGNKATAEVVPLSGRRGG